MYRIYDRRDRYRSLFGYNIMPLLSSGIVYTLPLSTLWRAWTLARDALTLLILMGPQFL